MKLVSLHTNKLNCPEPLAPRLTGLALALSVIVFPFSAVATETVLDPTVVTASPMTEPLTVVTDPRAPRQPIPAQDGADILKTIPGFSVIRKGGTGGDPVFRGMAGSRLNILLDGEHILGGCGGRMDPPTAYVFPESFDRMTILKGPQTVLHGPGNSAGTVLFERDRIRVSEPTAHAQLSGTAASFGRFDLFGEASYVTPDVYVRVLATRTRASDYKDGGGNDVHSAYKRWSGTLALGWTPDDDTLLELTFARSGGEAAYADRMMDGTKFDRENVGLRFEKHNLSPVVERVSAQIYYNYVDHVMDNFSLRTLRGSAQLSNPDRKTWGGRVATDLRATDNTLLKLGIDAQSNEHTIRRTVNYRAMPRVTDATFRQHGIFGEVHHDLGEQERVIAGLRLDRWQASDKRASGATAGTSRSATLTSGFARWERDLLATPATVYAGIGRIERFPDYWELFNKQSIATNSAFRTKPEQTTQIDVGFNYDDGTISTALSAFYAHLDDFILIDGVSKPGATVTRNIKARTMGLEAGVGWRFAPNWQADATLAYVRGKNRSDGTALAQMPPLEARVGLNWNDGIRSAGVLWRGVAAQTRVDQGKGNIAGRDVGKSSGFGVLSINGGYRIGERVQLTAGIDNLFDRKYAEHLSRGGFNVPGIIADTRVNEPGRTLWAKAVISFD